MPTGRRARPSGLGAVKGGAIGYAKSKNAYGEFLDALRRETTQRGLLLGER